MKKKQLLSLLFGLLISNPIFSKTEPVSNVWYEFFSRKNNFATINIIRKKSNNQLAPHIFIIKIKGFFGREEGSYYIRLDCRNTRYYTPVTIKVKEFGSNYLKRASFEYIKINNKLKLKMTHDSYGINKEKILPADTVFFPIVFEIVKDLAFDKKKVFTFQSMETLSAYIKENHRITYLGKEEKTINGKKLTLHKFEQKGERISPNNYWLNDSHELVYILIDGYKHAVLSTEKKAKEYYKKRRLERERKLVVANGL